MAITLRLKKVGNSVRIHGTTGNKFRYIYPRDLLNVTTYNATDNTVSIGGNNYFAPQVDVPVANIEINSVACTDQTSFETGLIALLELDTDGSGGGGGGQAALGQGLVGYGDPDDELTGSSGLKYDPVTGKFTIVALGSTGGGAVGVSADGSLVKLQDTGYGVVNGLDVVWLSGLTFFITAGQYWIDGVLYNWAGGSVTLDAADPDDPRIDLIVADAAGVGGIGNVVDVTGTPASDPAEPDTTPDQVRLTAVLINAGAVTPVNINEIKIYAENAGSPTEWPVSGTATFNANNATNPLSGTKDILISTMNQNAYIQFTGASLVDLADVSKLIIPIRLTNALPNNSNLVVSLMNGNTVISSTIQLTTKGLSRTLLNTYQIVVVDVASFTYTQTKFNRVKINRTGSGGTIAIRMDDIRFQKGLIQMVPATQPAIQTILTQDGNFVATTPGTAVTIKGEPGIATRLSTEESATILIRRAVVEISYADLKDLWDNEALSPGTDYAITDFATVHTIPNSGGATNTLGTETIVVTAVNEVALSPIARSISWPQDIIYYDIENNNTKMPGCTMGYIKRRIDTELNIDMPYDFRAVVFRRWKIDAASTGGIFDSGDVYAKGVVVAGPDGLLYISLVDGNTGEDVTDSGQWNPVGAFADDYFLFDNGTFEVFAFGSAFDLVADPASFQDYLTFNGLATRDVYIAQQGNNSSLINVVFMGGASNFRSTQIANVTFKTIVQACECNMGSCIVGEGFEFNKIFGIDTCMIGGGFDSNVVQRGCNNNLFGKDFTLNTIGLNFQQNIVSNSVNRNTVGPALVGNKFSYGQRSCDIKGGFSFGDYSGGGVVTDSYGKIIMTSSTGVPITMYWDDGTKDWKFLFADNSDATL